MIQCKNVMKKYGDKQALNDFSLELEKGRIIGLLGSNGSEKSIAIYTLGIFVILAKQIFCFTRISAPSISKINPIIIVNKYIFIISFS